MTEDVNDKQDGLPLIPERQKFIDRLSGQLVAAGMQRAPARVFACLLSEDSGSLTSKELSEALGISPSGVSAAVSYLNTVGMLTKVRRPGDRRDHYEVGDDVWNHLFEVRNALLADWGQITRDGAKAVGEDSPAGRRMNDSAEFFEFIRRGSAEMMSEWRKRSE